MGRNTLGLWLSMCSEPKEHLRVTRLSIHSTKQLKAKGVVRQLLYTTEIHDLVMY